MRELVLSQKKVALVDDEDYEWLSKWKWCVYKGNNTFYAGRNVKSTKEHPRNALFMHRLIMDCPRDIQVDHIDGNGLNNLRSNLRLCTSAQNQMNRGKNKNNTSGYKGVSWYKRSKKWRVQIGYKGNIYYLGCFDTTEEASKVYNEKALKLHGEFANLNGEN